MSLRRSPLIVCASLGLALLSAAEPRSQHGREMRRRGASIEEWVAGAARDAEAGHVEDAAATLRGAQALAASLLAPDERESHQARLSELQRAIDPRDATRRRALDAAASALRTIARERASSGAVGTAFELLGIVRGFDPLGADAELDSLLASHADAVRDAPPLTIDWAGGETVLGPDTWSTGADEVATGELDAKLADYLLLSASRLGPRFVARAELHFDRHSIRAGFVFGYRHREDYVAVEVSLLPRGRAAWIAKRKLPGTWQTLGSGELAAVLGADGLTLPLCVDTSRAGLQVTVGDEAPSIVVPPELGDVVPAGVFGVCASARVGIDRHVTWRGLRVTTLTPHVVRSDTTNTTDVVTAANSLAEVAESYLAAGWLDTGLQLLQLAADLGDDTTRASIEITRRRHGVLPTDRTETLFRSRPGAEAATSSQWSVTDGQLLFVPPPRDDDGGGSPAHLSLTSSRALPFRASATIRANQPDGAAGLYVGSATGGTDADSYRATLTEERGQATLHVTRVAPDRSELLVATRAHYFTRAEREAGVRLELDCDKHRLRCRAAGSEWAFVDVDALPHTVEFGCVVTRSAGATPVRFSMIDVWDR